MQSMALVTTNLDNRLLNEMRHRTDGYDMPRSLFLHRFLSAIVRVRKHDWHLYGALWRKLKAFAMISWANRMWVMNLWANLTNLVGGGRTTRSPTSFSAPLQKSLSADETVHIFNCTKIPLKFALNKLSRNKRNFKSHLPRSLRRHDIATVFIQFFLRFIVGERVWRNIYIRNRGKFPF